VQDSETVKKGTGISSGPKPIFKISVLTGVVIRVLQQAGSTRYSF
jgi:hypothetical protein